MSEKNTVSRETLTKAAALVRPALATQAYIPALTHIKFDAGRAVAYNDVSGISVRVAAGINRCLPGELFIRALGSFGAESIMFQEAADGAVVISSGRSKVKLPSIDPSKFPFELPDNSTVDGTIEMDHSILKGIHRCLLSVGSDPTHPAQMGVTLDTDAKGCAVLYSTDNFTISRFQTKSKIRLPGDAPVILPTFFCEQLTGLAAAFPEEPINLWLGAGYVLAEFGKSAELFTKTVLDLEPLDFPRIVEKHCKLDTVLKQSAAIPDNFDAALARALLVLGGEVDKITKVTVLDGSLKMHSTSAMGDADDSMAFSNEDIDIPGEPFYVDPALVARAAKVSALVAFLPRVVVMSGEDGQFIHLVAHCNK